MIAVSLAEHAAINGELTLKAFEQNHDNVQDLKAAKDLAAEEAMIRTVAAMMERNNQALMQHLKKFGVLQDHE